MSSPSATPDDVGHAAECLFTMFKNGYQALGQLLAQYREYLIAVIREEMPDELQGRLGASDIVHDAYVNVFSRLEREAAGVLSVRAEENLRSWLRRVALNTLENRTRNETRHKRDVGRERPGGTDGFDPAAATSSVTSMVLRSERDLELERALEALPEVDRALMRLRYWYDVKLSVLGVLLTGEVSDASRMAATRRITEIHDQLRADQRLGDHRG